MLKIIPNHFFKFHGTGNDFVLVFQNSINYSDKINLAKKLCHRKFGIGADGLLIIRFQQPLYKMEIINSDGSMAKMCGNGLRCFSALIYKLNLVKQQFQVLTDDGKKYVKMLKSQNQIQIQKVEKYKKKYYVQLLIGKGSDIKQIQNKIYKLSDPFIYFTVIGVPHVVLFLSSQEESSINFEDIGQLFQKNYDANINFCFIQKQSKIRVTTYQRGAGLTYSCGTGVCSTAYIGNKMKGLNQSVKVQTEGGQLQISINKQNQIMMKGPAQQICQGTFSI